METSPALFFSFLIICHLDALKNGAYTIFTEKLVANFTNI